eukprot:c34873_g1_i1.p1 GENE.c34873_g1_i1~~c34873_g1_i1.p1  ORF type:complete len:130 (+),score=7.68 c34873_g1_i1:46-435(+)
MLVLSLLLVACAASAMAEGNVAVLTDANFSQLVTGSKSGVFVKFYAPWCGHCKKLAPTWAQLADKYAGDSSVTIAHINCDEHRTTCQAHEVKGYPTLVWFPSGPEKSKTEKYGGARSLEDLSKFVDSKK